MKPNSHPDHTDANQPSANQQPSKQLATYQLADYPSLGDFLTTTEAATLAVPIDQAGAVHAAGLLYWHTADPLRLYFVTSRRSTKCRLLQSQASVPCAVVVGTERGVPFTLQLRGRLAIIDHAQYPELVAGYYHKRGNHHDDLDNPDKCLLEFHPTWGRFTDYSKGYLRCLLRLDT